MESIAFKIKLVMKGIGSKVTRTVAVPSGFSVEDFVKAVLPVFGQSADEPFGVVVDGLGFDVSDVMLSDLGKAKFTVSSGDITLAATWLKDIEGFEGDGIEVVKQDGEIPGGEPEPEPADEQDEEEPGEPVPLDSKAAARLMKAFDDYRTLALVFDRGSHEIYCVGKPLADGSWPSIDASELDPERHIQIRDERSYLLDAVYDFARRFGSLSAFACSRMTERSYESFLEKVNHSGLDGQWNEFVHSMSAIMAGRWARANGFSMPGSRD